MKYKLYRIWRTFIGIIIAGTGSVLLGNGIVYIYEIINLCMEKEENILKLGYYSRIGFVSCEFAFLIGLIFVIIGIYIIRLGAKVADRLTTWKNLMKANRKTHIV